MAGNDDVDISVKIKDDFSGTLEKLKQKIESIGGIEEIIAKIDDSDLDEALAKKEALEGDTNSTHKVNYREDGDIEGPPKPPGRIHNMIPDGTDEWFDRMKKLEPSTGAAFGEDGSRNEFLRNIQDNGLNKIGATGKSHPHLQSQEIQQESLTRAIEEATDRNVRTRPDGVGINPTSFGQEEVSGPRADLLRNSKRSIRGGIDYDEGFLGKLDRKSRTKINGFLSGITDKFDGLDGKLKKMVPTMHKWMQLVAAVLPMMISLGVAAMGVAASFGAVAAAGGAMVGLGLMGMEDSQKRLEQFKKELNNTFEGTAKQFAPLADSILTRIPGMLSGVANALGGLSVFKGTFLRSLQTIAGAIETLIRRAVSLSPIIEQLTNRFLGMATSGIVNFLTWLTKEAYRNQDAMVSLGEIFGNILITIYNLSKAVSAVVIGFKPLFGILKMISSVLKNEFAVRMAQGIAIVYSMVKAMKALRAATMTSGVGALLVGAGLVANEFLFTGKDGKGVSGFGGSTPSGTGGGGDTYVMDVQGDVTDRHIKKFESISSQTTDQAFSEIDKRER